MDEPAAPPLNVPAPGAQSSAANILLLWCGHACPQDHSLEREVDEYLRDPEMGTGTLEFWQVSTCLSGWSCC
jgi:hypothetical protein